MAYIDTGALAGNSAYLSRLQACCTEQAGVFINDARPEFVDVADAVITDVGNAMWFAWVVASQPGFGDAYAGGGEAAISDAMLLSAVQAVWPIVGAAHPSSAASAP